MNQDKNSLKEFFMNTINIGLLSIVLFITSSHAALQQPQGATARFQYPFSQASARSAIQYVDCHDAPGGYDHYCTQLGWTITPLSESAIDAANYHPDLSDTRIYTNENLVRANIGKELAKHYKKTCETIKQWIQRGIQEKDAMGRTCLLFAVCEAHVDCVKELVEQYEVKNTVAQDHEGNNVFDLIKLREEFWKHTVLFDNKEVMNNIETIKTFLIAALPFQYKAKFIKQSTALPQPVSQLIAEFSGTEVDKPASAAQAAPAVDVDCTDRCVIA